MNGLINHIHGDNQMHNAIMNEMNDIKSALLLQREINVEIMNENKKLRQKSEEQDKVIEKLKFALTDAELIHLGIW